MDEDLVGCQICNKAVAGINLKSHILQEHCNLLSDTECALCEQKFAAKHILKAHIKKVHLTEKSTCHICHKEYRDLQHHIKYTHDQDKQFECFHCEKKFQAKQILTNHIQSVHLDQHKRKCPLCAKDISLNNFTRHIKEGHNKVKKLCPHCDKEFGMSNLRKHIRNVHNNECVICPDCGKTFSISNLRKHILSVHEKLKNICEICNKEVPYSNISIHKRKEHGIGKPIDQVTPRGPNLKLRKEYRRNDNPDQIVYYMNDGNDVVKEIATNDEEDVDIKNEELEKVKVEDWMVLDVDTSPATKTIIVGGKNFVFSSA